MNSKEEHFSKVAILLFAQSEEKESATKPLVCNKEQTLLFWRKMNELVLKNIKKTGIPYFVSNENDQVGVVFGERLLNSINKIINLGFDKVVIVGNDCPELKCNHLIEAITQLQKNNFVIGGNFKGGTYLIGITKAVFNAEDFVTVNWQTKTVFNELKVLFKESSLAYLPLLNDCNVAADLRKIILRLSFSDTIIRFITLLLQVRSQISTIENSIILNPITSLNLNKGSPSFRVISL